MLKAFLFAAAALLSVACATAIRLAPVTPGSAADPNSFEPATPPLSQTLRPDGPSTNAAAPPAAAESSGLGEAAHTGHTEDKSMPTAIVYTCPMHPEVRSDKPGTCPKCGMKLVPAKPSSDPGSAK